MTSINLRRCNRLSPSGSSCFGNLSCLTFSPTYLEEAQRDARPLSAPLSSQIWKSHEIKTSWSDSSGQQRSSSEFGLSIAGIADLKVATIRRWRKRRRTRFRSIGLAIPTETGTAEVTSNSVLWQTRRSAWRYLSEPCTALYLILPYSTSSGEPVHNSWHNDRRFGFSNCFNAC
jgi:hypothetical protein